MVVRQKRREQSSERKVVATEEVKGSIIRFTFFYFVFSGELNNATLISINRHTFYFFKEN